MDENQDYRRFKLIFHLLIFIFAMTVIGSSIAGWNDMTRAPLYLILGLIIAGRSLYGLYKNFKHKTID